LIRKYAIYTVDMNRGLYKFGENEVKMFIY
jgi:hypothetical protein